MNRVVRSAALLIVVAVLALSATLAWQRWTLVSIVDAQRQLQTNQWLAVLPPGSYDNQPLDHSLPVVEDSLPQSRITAAYLATLAGKPSAVVLVSKVQGYAGPILLTIAITVDGHLLGSRVIEQAESPGLGGRIVDPQLNWLDQFEQRQLGDRWALKRDQGDFDQLAGATVTSRAVIDAHQEALRFFDQHRDRWLGAPTHE